MSLEDLDDSIAERVRRQLRASARFAKVALNADAELVDVLQAACQAACNGSGVGHSKVMLHDPARDTLVIRAGVGWHAGVIGMRVPMHARSVPGTTLLSGKPLIVGDLYADPGFDVHEPLKSHRILSAANVPIMLNQAVLGVLELDSTEPMALSGDDIDFLSSLAELIAAAIMRLNYERIAQQTDERLRENEERLRMALGAAKMGTWVRRPAADQQAMDENLCRLMGLPPEQTIRTFDEFLAAIHPQDRATVDAAFERSLREGVDLAVEFRVVQADGSVRWLQDQGRVFADPAGRPAFMTGACVDITERKQAELQLQRADRIKTEFLAMLAHELRGPMAPLANAVSLLERRHDDAQQARQALGIMRRQLDHLKRLAGDLLEVSRVEQGKIELRLEPMVLADALAAAVEAAQPLVEARAQRLAVSLPSRAVRIQGDAVRITQVVSNLLGNAAKFTPEGGVIELVVEDRAHEVDIVVRDNGLGISSEALPHVFGLFEQGDVKALDRSQGGLGIGLALVKRLVELHGGSVMAESEGAGRGATFTVRLPRQTPPG